MTIDDSVLGISPGDNKCTVLLTGNMSQTTVDNTCWKPSKRPCRHLDGLSSRRLRARSGRVVTSRQVLTSLGWCQSGGLTTSVLLGWKLRRIQPQIAWHRSGNLMAAGLETDLFLVVDVRMVATT